jgi:hypothetical protein
LRAALLVAELLLDRLHLLVEPVLPLGVVALALHPGLELLLDLEELDLGEQRAVHALEAGRHGHGLEELLALLELELERRDEQVGEPVGVLHRVDGEEHLGRHRPVELDEALERRLDGSDQRADLGLGGFVAGGPLGREGLRAVELLELDLEPRVVRDEPGDARAALALDQDLGVAVREGEDLLDGRDRAERVHVSFVWRGVVAGALRREEDLASRALDRALHRGERLRPPDDERHRRVGEHHHRAQRQQRPGPALLPLHPRLPQTQSASFS